MCPSIGRVVNTWFWSGSSVVPHTSSLPAGQQIEFYVNVGAPDSRSNVGRPAPIDEGFLESLYADGAVPLRVVVSCRAFSIDQPVEVLSLPPPPTDAGGRLAFQHRHGNRTRHLRLRVGVYHRNNLLQSIICVVAVTSPQEYAHRVGNEAEFEWSMSGFHDLDRFDEPALTILTNQDPGGTHTLVVVGHDGGCGPCVETLDIAPDKLGSTVHDVHDELQKVCSTFRNGKLDKYRSGRRTAAMQRSSSPTCERLRSRAAGCMSTCCRTRVRHLSSNSHPAPRPQADPGDSGQIGEPRVPLEPRVRP